MQNRESFEQFIITCCEMDEWDLRTFLKGKLSEAGFLLKEDDYRSYRLGRYQEIHNLLAIRGNQPAVCYVAHTDVCRDHGSLRDHKKTKPVIKEVEKFGRRIRIIQDEHTKVQVGGDDRLGVAINTWLALTTSQDMGLLFTTDEEVGNQSADEIEFKEMGNFDLCCQVDRGNHSNQLVINISGVQLCDKDTAERLLNISKLSNLPRYPVAGLMTDVLSLKDRGKIRNAVNMTCGYHSSMGSSPHEYIVIDEACDTFEYVKAILDDYNSTKSMANFPEPEPQESVVN